MKKILVNENRLKKLINLYREQTDDCPIPKKNSQCLFLTDDDPPIDCYKDCIKKYLTED